MNKINYFGLRMGKGGKYIPQAKKGNFVAIGWNKLGDISWISKEKDETKIFDRLKKLYKAAYGEASPNAIGINSGQIIRFIREVKKGDIVLVPDPINRTVLIGRVVGDYQYKEDWGDDCDYKHRLNVEWIKEGVSRDELSQKFKYSIGSLLTIFNLGNYEDEIQRLISGEKPEKEKGKDVSGKELRNVTLDRLHSLSGEEFERFITHLFSLIGFEAATTQLIGDKGVDISGTLNVEGLTQITLKIQVKRISGQIGNKEILQIRGTLGADEHGALITTSSFTKQAREEAETEGKKSIQLIEGEELVDIILKHYSELDEKYKKLLKIKKKEIPITEQFFTFDKTK